MYIVYFLQMLAIAVILMFIHNYFICSKTKLESLIDRKGLYFSVVYALIFTIGFKYELSFLIVLGICMFIVGTSNFIISKITNNVV